MVIAPDDEAKPDVEVDRGWLILRLLLGLLALVLVGWTGLHLRFGPEPVWVMTCAGVLKYLDWFLVAWVGTILYLITNVGTFMARDKPKFVRFTAWYASTAIRGPFFAVVVLVLATNIGFKIGQATGTAGLEVNIGALSPPVLLGVAFVLGWFHRVALQQLVLFAQYFFTKASALAEDRPFVIPNAADVVPGGKVAFTVDPAASVVWSATVGSVDVASGTYTAPAVTAAEFQAAKGQLAVIVRAHLKAAPGKSSYAEVHVVPFKIDVPAAAKVGEVIDLRVEPAIADVAWQTTGGALDVAKLTIPPDAKSVTVTASSKKWGHTAHAAITVDK